MQDVDRFGNGRIGSLIFTYSLPTIVGMLAGAIYNVIDRIYIGNSSGALGIAGVTIGFPLMIIQMAFGVLIGMGATTLVSIKLGEGKQEEAAVIAGNTFLLQLIMSFLLTAFGLLFLTPILKFFGAAGAILPYAKDYMQVIMLGTVFNLLSGGMNSLMRAEGKPIIAMASMLISVFLNVGLAPLFIFVFGWGIRGAALATVLSQAVSAAWIVLHFVFGRGILRFRPHTLRLRTDIIVRIAILGFPPFSMQLAQCFLTIILNLQLVHYGGDVAISGMGIVNSITTLFIQPIIGINQGVQPIIGYNYGAKNYARVKEALWYAVLFATAFSLICFAITRAIPTQLMGLFDSRDRELIVFGSKALRIVFLSAPIIGFQVVGSGYFQSIGKPVQSLLLSMTRQVLILIPLLLVLPFFFEQWGVLVSMPISDVCSAIVTGICLWAGLKRLHKQDSLQVYKTPLGRNS